MKRQIGLCAALLFIGILAESCMTASEKTEVPQQVVTFTMDWSLPFHLNDSLSEQLNINRAGDKFSIYKIVGYNLDGRADDGTIIVELTPDYISVGHSYDNKPKSLDDIEYAFSDIGVDFIVDDKGDFVHSRNEDIVDEVTYKMSNALRDKDESFKPTISVGDRNQFNSRFIGLTKAKWDQIVGHWVGRTFVIGQTYSRREKIYIGDFEIPVVQKLKVIKATVDDHTYQIEIEEINEYVGTTKYINSARLLTSDTLVPLVWNYDYTLETLDKVTPLHVTVRHRESFRRGN
jgi:hypothetical protein